MITRAQIKLIRSLSLKKYRRKHGLFKVEGAKIVKETLSKPQIIDSVYALPEWISENQGTIDKLPFLVEEVTPAQLREISELDTPQQVIAIMRLPTQDEEKIKAADFCLVLDGIRDPGNMGTIIRTADWFGLSHIYISVDCTDAYSPKTVQASMGSILRIAIHEVDIPSWLTENSLAAYAAALEGGQSIYPFRFPQNTALVIGNESQGVSQEVLDVCAGRVFIPSFGEAESLNAAMATGILLNHWRMGEGS